MIPKYDLSNASDVEEVYNMLDTIQAGLVCNSSNPKHEEIRAALEQVVCDLQSLMEDMADA